MDCMSKKEGPILKDQASSFQRAPQSKHEEVNKVNVKHGCN